MHVIKLVKHMHHNMYSDVFIKKCELSKDEMDEPTEKLDELKLIADAEKKWADYELKKKTTKTIKQ